jgi:hypothetical protein
MLPERITTRCGLPGEVHDWQLVALGSGHGRGPWGWDDGTIHEFVVGVLDPHTALLVAIVLPYVLLALVQLVEALGASDRLPVDLRRILGE